MATDSDRTEPAGRQQTADALYDEVEAAVREALYDGDDVDPVGWAVDRIMKAIDQHRTPPTTRSRYFGAQGDSSPDTPPAARGEQS